jgi:hypothetical protein
MMPDLGQIHGLDRCGMFVRTTAPQGRKLPVNLFAALMQFCHVVRKNWPAPGLDDTRLS